MAKPTKEIKMAVTNEDGTESVEAPISEADQAVLNEIEQGVIQALSAKPELTYKQAAQLTGFTESRIRSAVKADPVFKAEGAVIKREIEGTDFKVTYLSTEAVKAYAANQANKSTAGVSRVKSTGTKYTFFATPEQYAHMTATAIAQGVVIEKAYKGVKPLPVIIAEAPTAEGAEPDQAEGLTTMEDLFKSEPVTA